MAPAESEEAAQPRAITTDTVLVIVMDGGEIAIRLRPDVAPKTCAAIAGLARKGYYDGLTFHRVERGILIQGGCPDGTGMGGPGFTLDAEFSSVSHVRGTVAMARRGNDINSAGSQFYICLRPLPSLDGDYTVFGEVVRGMEVADGVGVGDVMSRVYVEGD